MGNGRGLFQAELGWNGAIMRVPLREEEVLSGLTSRFYNG
jgi:hypothetical protein